MSFNTTLSVVDDYVVFDTETTGRYYEFDDITEIGAAKVINGEVVERFEMLLNPGKPIPQVVVELTGITNAMVADAPPSKEGVASFLNFADGLPLVGHNVTFDAYMLHVDNLPNTLIDTMRIGRRVARNLPDHRLGTLYAYCQSLGHEAQLDGSAHRADYDAEMTRIVYETLKPELAELVEYERQRRSEYSGGPTARLSESTIRKATILAQVRNLVDNGIETYEQIADLCDTIAADECLASDTAFSNLLAVMSQAVSDDVITIEEQMDILKECRKLADPVVRDSCFTVDVAGSRFVLTGGFEHGSDAEVIAAVAAAGGEAHKKAPSAKDNYVVVGNLGSKRWAFGDYGTKVDKAIAMQAKGKPIVIISESVLFASLG